MNYILKDQVDESEFAGVPGEPRWHPRPPIQLVPEIFLGAMPTSRNGAIIVGSPDASGTMTRCLIKPGMPEPQTSLIEWVGASLSRALGLITPNSFCVMLTHDFIATLPPEVRGRCSGPCEIYGAEFIDGLQPIAKTGLIDSDRREDAWRVVGLDAFMHNSERNRDNPNAALLNGSILVYDHDSALEFLHTPVRNDERSIRGNGLPWILNHVFSGRLGDTPMSDSVQCDINAITDQWFKELWRYTPRPWFTRAHERIERVIVSRSRHSCEWLPEVGQSCTK